MTTKKGIGTMLYRARVGSRFLPVLGTVASRVTIYGTAAYLAWKVYQHYSDGSTVPVDLWLDNASLGRDALFNPAGIPSDVGGANPQNNWYWAGASMVKLSGSTCAATGSTECFAVELAPAYCGSCAQGGGNQFWNNSYLSSEASGTLAASATQYPFYWNPGGSSPVKSWTTSLDWDYCRLYGQDWQWTCFGAADGNGTNATAMGYLIWRTLQNLSDGRTIAGAQSVAVNGTQYSSAAYPAIPTRKVLVAAPDYGKGASAIPDPGGTTPALTTDYNVPATAGDTSADATAALDALDTVCGRSLVNYLLSDGLYPWPAGCIENAPASEPDPVTFTLPRPQANETYADYVQRLRDAGWLGTATEVVLDPADPSIGTSAVQKIGVTGRTGTWRRALWPTTDPVLAPSVNLTFWRNPDTAPPVAPDPTDEDNPEGGGGVVDPGTGSSDCSCPPIDFGPLSGVGTTTKFPFGVFSWVQDVFSGFSGSVAPSETLTTPIGPVTIDLAGSSGNVATVRSYTDPVFKFFVVLGSVWWLATSIIGLGRGGIEHGD